jgi:hypothetical protein
MVEMATAIPVRMSWLGWYHPTIGHWVAGAGGDGGWWVVVAGVSDVDRSSRTLRWSGETGIGKPPGCGETIDHPACLSRSCGIRSTKALRARVVP